MWLAFYDVFVCCDMLWPCDTTSGLCFFRVERPANAGGFNIPKKSQHATSYDRKGHLNFRTRWSNSGEEKASEFWSDWCVFYSWSPSFWGVVKKVTEWMFSPKQVFQDLILNCSPKIRQLGPSVLDCHWSRSLPTASPVTRKMLKQKHVYRGPSLFCQMFETIFSWNTETFSAATPEPRIAAEIRRGLNLDSQKTEQK